MTKKNLKPKHTLRDVMGSFLLVSLMLLTSCGDKSAKVSADIEIVSSMAIEGLNMEGGAVIAGETTDQANSFVRTFLPGEDFSVIMEQATWNFSIVTYSGEDGMLSGDTECAFLDNVEIDADTDSVEVTVNSDYCSKAGLRMLRIRSCTESSYAEIDPLVFDSSYCGSGSGDSEHLGSLRVSYLDHTNLVELGDSITSFCLSKESFEDDYFIFLSGEGLFDKVLSKFELFKTDDCSGRSRTITHAPSIANVTMPLKFHYIVKGDDLRAAILFNTEGALLDMENLNTAPNLATPYNHILGKKLETILTGLGSAHFTDPNDDEITYSCYYDLIVNETLDKVSGNYTSCDNMPGSGSFSESTGLLSWVFSTGAADSYEVTIKATDGQESTSATFAINLMNELDSDNPNTDELAIWLQAKESYLYQDVALSSLATNGSTPLAWRNIIPNGSESHSFATSASGQAPTLKSDSLMTEGELALAFNSTAKTYFSFPDGDYDIGGEGTMIVYASNTSDEDSGSYTLISKTDNVGGDRTYKLYQNANQKLHGFIEGSDSTAVNFSSTGSVITDTSFCAAMRVGSTSGSFMYNFFTSGDSSAVVSNLAISGLYNSDGPLMIGTYHTAVGGWDGSISEVLVWKRALTDDEIAAECTRLKTLYGITLL